MVVWIVFLNCLANSVSLVIKDIPRECITNWCNIITNELAIKGDSNPNDKYVLSERAQ